MVDPKPIGYVRLEWRHERGVWQKPGGPHSDELERLCVDLREGLVRLRHDRVAARIELPSKQIIIQERACVGIRLSLLHSEPMPLVEKRADIGCCAHEAVFERSRFFCTVIEMFDDKGEAPALTIHLFLDPEERRMPPFYIGACGLVYRRDEVHASLFEHRHEAECDRHHPGARKLSLN